MITEWRRSLLSFFSGYLSRANSWKLKVMAASRRSTVEAAATERDGLDRDARYLAGRLGDTSTVAVEAQSRFEAAERRLSGLERSERRATS